MIMDKEENILLVDYFENGKEYKIYKEDFKKIKHYCLNECMGIQFVISAELLMDLVKNLSVLNFDLPFSSADFLSEKSISLLKEKGGEESMKKNFGTNDLKKVLGLIIKQTYNFLHKV